MLSIAQSPLPQPNRKICKSHKSITKRTSRTLCPGRWPHRAALAFCPAHSTHWSSSSSTSLSSSILLYSSITIIIRTHTMLIIYRKYKFLLITNLSNYRRSAWASIRQKKSIEVVAADGFVFFVLNAFTRSAHFNEIISMMFT